MTRRLRNHGIRSCALSALLILLCSTGCHEEEGRSERVGRSSARWDALSASRSVSASVGDAAAAAEDRPSEAWLSQARRAIAEREYRASETSRGLQAPNRAHRLRSYFDSKGVRVVDRLAPDSPDLVRLSLVGLGRGDLLEGVEDGVVGHEAARVEIAHPNILQWFVNSRAGLEQGFTLASRPVGSEQLALFVRVEGGRVDSSGSGLTFLSQATGRRLRYDKLLAEDATGKALPSRMFAVADGFRIEVDDREAIYPVVIDPLLMGSFDHEIAANATNVRLGSHVASAGDVNADGFADLLIGAPGYDSGQANEGSVFLFLGGEGGVGNGNPFNADAEFESNLAGANLEVGRSAGDVNGDGYGDIVLACFTCSNGQSSEGLVMVFHGSASGIADGHPGTADALLEGGAFEAFFGIDAVSAGDVNGDGFDDLLVGHPAYTNGQVYEGAAYLFYGGASGLGDGLASSADVTIESNQELALLGRWVSGAGDVNGDGFADILVAAPAFDAFTVPDNVVAFVFHGSAAGIASTQNPLVESQAILASDQAGSDIRVSRAGDVNGDGFGDVLVGFPLYDSPTVDTGLVLLVEGSATGLPDAYPGGESSSITYLNTASARAGSSVSAAGDVNGDGYGDIIIGVGGNSASSMVFLGSGSGIATTNAWGAYAVLYEGQNDSEFGASVAGVGDVNGDGFDDVVVGAPYYDAPETDEGQAFVYHGGAAGIRSGSVSSAETQLESDQGTSSSSSPLGPDFGFHVASAGDVNGDGYGDVIVGAYRYDSGGGNGGAAFIFLGSASGIADGTSAMAHAQLESDQAWAGFGNSVASAGDVNGDGYGDVIVGSWSYDSGEEDEGAAFVFHGSGDGRTVLVRQIRNNASGLAIQPEGGSHLARTASESSSTRRVRSGARPPSSRLRSAPRIRASKTLRARAAPPARNRSLRSGPI